MSNIAFECIVSPEQPLVGGSSSFNYAFLLSLTSNQPNDTLENFWNDGPFEIGCCVVSGHKRNQYHDDFVISKPSIERNLLNSGWLITIHVKFNFTTRGKEKQLKFFLIQHPDKENEKLWETNKIPICIMSAPTFRQSKKIKKKKNLEKKKTYIKQLEFIASKLDFETLEKIISLPEYINMNI